MLVSNKIRNFAETYTLMMKNLLQATIACALLFGMPSMAKADTAIEMIEQDVQQVNVVLQENNTLHVTGANGQTLYIYNVAGVRVMSIKVEGADRRLELNLPKGCYIVKVGKTVRKISIK